MIRNLGIAAFVFGLLLGAGLFAQTTSKPATTSAPASATASAPASPACCGDTCKKMGACCKVDDKGKASCPMGGSCCNK
jgi:hypothetical protein